MYLWLYSNIWFNDKYHKNCIQSCSNTCILRICQNSPQSLAYSNCHFVLHSVSILRVFPCAHYLKTCCFGICQHSPQSLAYSNDHFLLHSVSILRVFPCAHYLKTCCFGNFLLTNLTCFQVLCTCTLENYFFQVSFCKGNFLCGQNISQCSDWTPLKANAWE